MTNSEAINLLDNLLGVVEDNHGSDYDMALRMAIDALKQPERIAGRAVYQAGYADGYNSAQLERKAGKWLPDNNNYYEERFICSVCGKSYKVDTCMGKPMWDFCPCGADMRGEEHETDRR